jgi:hypothetical protein
MGDYKNDKGFLDSKGSWTEFWKELSSLKSFLKTTFENR